MTAEPWGKPISQIRTLLKWKGAFNLSVGTAGVDWDYARQTGRGNVRGREDVLGFFTGSSGSVFQIVLLPSVYPQQEASYSYPRWPSST